MSFEIRARLFHFNNGQQKIRSFKEHIFSFEKKEILTIFFLA